MIWSHYSNICVEILINTKNIECTFKKFSFSSLFLYILSKILFEHWSDFEGATPTLWNKEHKGEEFVGFIKGTNSHFNKVLI